MIALSALILAMAIGSNEPYSVDPDSNEQFVPSIDAVLGLNWNQPITKQKASPSLDSRFGLSYETAGIGVGKAGHLDVSVGLVYTTRACELDSLQSRVQFGMIQAPILGHGPIMGLSWLEAAAGVTPGWVFDFIQGRSASGDVPFKQELASPISVDITIGVIAQIGILRLRFLLYNSPVSQLENNALMFSGFFWDAHIPIYWKRRK